MKALYLYSDKTGIKKPQKYQEYIIKKLQKIYDSVDAVKTSSLDDFCERCKTAKDEHDVLIIAGGDGTFSAMVDTISRLPEEKRPIIGYLPMGTINDAGKTFGVRGTVSQALRILKKKRVIGFDVCKANDRYFAYVLAIGQYSDISYITKRSEKKMFGRLSYYRVAIGQAFKKRIVNVKVTIDGETKEYKTPFVLLLNGPSVGGFKINFKPKFNDGYFDLFLTKPGIFNGLLHYIFFKIKTTHIKAEKVILSTDQNGPWCIDGESSLSGDVEVTCLKNHLMVFGKKR